MTSATRTPSPRPQSRAERNRKVITDPLSPRKATVAGGRRVVPPGEIETLSARRVRWDVMNARARGAATLAADARAGSLSRVAARLAGAGGGRLVCAFSAHGHGAV